jgi:hypothetical protein
MTDTLLASIDTWVMSEVLSQLALAPLRSRFATLPYINHSSIDGVAAEDRKIRKRDDLAVAVDDSESTGFTGYEEFVDATPITLTPTGKVQGVKVSVKALRRAMPGASRQEVLAAIKSGNPAALPLLSQIAEELIDSHYRAAETAAMALFSGAGATAFGTTNTELAFAALVDGQTTMLEDNRPEHRTMVCVVGARGIGQLRSAVFGGAGEALSAVFASGYATEFLNAIGGAPPSAATPFGSLIGMPIIEGESDLMANANGTTDKVCAIFCVGRGETGTPGSLRGFAEFCEGHSLDVQLEYDLEEDIVKALGRYEWDVKEHTDEHIVDGIYKAAA